MKLFIFWQLYKCVFIFLYLMKYSTEFVLENNSIERLICVMVKPHHCWTQEVCPPCFCDSAAFRPFRYTFCRAFLTSLNELNDYAGQHEVIAENLTSQIITDLTRYLQELKAERKSVSWFFFWFGLPACLFSSPDVSKNVFFYHCQST